LKEKREKPVKKLKYQKVDGRIQNMIGPDGKAVTYVSEERTVDNVWRIRCLQPANQQEWVNYDTQKPVDLIERILAISSNEGDLMLDCFCGSGSSLVAAEKTRLKWIGCDLGRFAIHTTRKRLLAIPNVRPFVVQNLGKYERQAWQEGEFGQKRSEVSGQKSEYQDAAEQQRAYMRFILELYHAKPVSGYSWLHEVKLKLTDFVIPPDDVPEEARKAVKHWSQWIDYWAVDWNNRSDTFHNEWQTYRTRKDNALALETTHDYIEKGDYIVVVKVIDILGNDTTKTVKASIL
jgi:hypothetical protein